MAETLGTKLPRRRLGRSGLEVPGIALGGAGLGGIYGKVSDADAIEAVQYAVAQGVDYVDTDASYGDSERRIGLALEGGLREKIALSTKTGTHPERRGDYSWDGTLWNVENSLRLLKTDYFDLVLVHDPSDMKPVLAPRGAFDALQSLKEQGVIKSIGLGQRSHEFHRQAIEDGRVDVILTYADYNPIHTTALTGGLLELAAQHDIGVLNGSPLHFGALAGQDPDQNPSKVWLGLPEAEKEAARRLYRWCRKRGLNEKAVVFGFCLRQPRIHCTLIGAETRQEVEQDLAAALEPLPDSIWEALASLRLPEQTRAAA